ncbi:MAG: hypothetical protein M1825_004569 [Sarcosagium campestre]|nr:MAG: hypothetical protein M1825_004569 [Sarcosagium campestre]
MDFTRTVKALKYCTPSPHGGLIATLESSTLTLYSTEALEPHRVINLEPEFSARISHVQWSRRSEVKAEDAPTIDYQDDSFLDLLDGAKMKSRKPVPLPLRILVADDDTVRVWDAYDKERRWTIENASGVLAKLVHVEFGRTVDELLVFSDFGVKLKIWSLVDGSSVEISDPKFPTGGGHEIRPRTGELTLLTRTNGRDTLSIHNPDTHDLFRATSAATTDAQGLQWSPCGRWITVWDAAFMGYRISFFTADGRLCRVVDSQSKWTREMPGISMLKWSPNSKHLLVGDYFGVFRILNQRVSIYLRPFAWTSPLAVRSTSRFRRPNLTGGVSS